MNPKDCIEQNKRQVPLVKVVKSAIVDVYGNVSELQELYSHFAARGLRKLQTEVLRVGKRKVMLTVNKNTNTATLPLDFGEDIFVGYINDRGQKVPLKFSHKIADACNIEEVSYEDKCTSCGQDKTICEDLAVTEDVELVMLNGTAYEKITIKKLYPNGDYYIETVTPVVNIENKPEEKAVGSIKIDSVGDEGDLIEVFVDDPMLNQRILLGRYEQLNSDSTPNVLAGNIVNALFGNMYGYSISLIGNSVVIFPPDGYGSSINGGSRLTVMITDAKIFDDTFDDTFE